MFHVKHLLSGEVIGADVRDERVELCQFLLSYGQPRFVTNDVRIGRAFENGFFDEQGSILPQRQRHGVAWAGIKLDDPAMLREKKLGEEHGALNVVDKDMIDAGIKIRNRVKE